MQMTGKNTEHDEEWLATCATHDDAERESQIQFARDYHEHMMRWRPISEVPETPGYYIMYDKLDGPFKAYSFC